MRRSRRIAASIKEWGWTSPALVGEDGGLIAGHARILATRQLGIAEIPVMVAAGWSDAQKRAYVLADNQLAITGSGWDPELLRLELGELKLTGFDLTLTGFNDLELGSLLADKTDGRTDPDDAPAAPEHPVSQTGDLWLLGRHRLLCGDSTVATDVERVLGGVVPDIAVCDPPYGISIVGGGKSFSKHGTVSGGGIFPSNLYEPVIGDDTTETAIAQPLSFCGHSHLIATTHLRYIGLTPQPATHESRRNPGGFHTAV
jgi:hypothetical protein